MITGDFNTVENISLRNEFAKGPKCRQPQSISWKFNFKIIIDSVEDYVMTVGEVGKRWTEGSISTGPIAWINESKIYEDVFVSGILSYCYNRF